MKVYVITDGRNAAVGSVATGQEFRNLAEYLSEAKYALGLTLAGKKFAGEIGFSKEEIDAVIRTEWPVN